MNKRELEILKIGFNAGKKAIEMHPENDEYDTIRFNEAQELVKNLDISLVSICVCGTEKYQESEKRADNLTYCSRCDKPY